MNDNRALKAHLSLLFAEIFWGLMAPVGKDAMAHGIHKWPESRWLQLEQTVQPPQDLFSTPPAQEQGAQPSTHAAPTQHQPAQPATTTADEDIFAPISLQ